MKLADEGRQIVSDVFLSLSLSGRVLRCLIIHCNQLKKGGDNDVWSITLIIPMTNGQKHHRRT